MKAVFLVLLAGAALRAQIPEQTEFFEKKIRPVFATQCNGCHNAKLKISGLDLSTSEGFWSGGARGALLSKEKPEDSLLLKVLTYHDNIKMPPSGKLKDEPMADIAAWVKMGAPWPDAGTAPKVLPPQKGSKYEFTKEQRAYWAFQPVRDPQPPAVKNAAWARSPIDRFILAKLEAKGLEPAKPASKIALLRRATYDLTGLPPSKKEIDDFLADSSADAFAKVVDRLLASPRYGERWGRHWLDVVRYADSTGADEDIRYPYAWRYRDYVIAAFNSDLPYNQFVKEQLAGDLMPSADGAEVNKRGVIATGFLQVGLKLLAEQDKPKMVYDMIDEQVDTTTRAFMAMSVACARCHDHKFDPIPTKDYYSLAGIFASTKTLSKVEGTVSQLYFAPLVPRAEYMRYEEAQKRITSKQREIENVGVNEGVRFAAPLQPQVAKYMTAAYRYQKRPVADIDLCVEDFARREKLDARVLDRWVKYTTETNDFEPHLEKWFAAVKQGPAAVAASAKEYQGIFDSGWTKWKEQVGEWNGKLAAALAEGKDVPERPNFEAGNNRFFGTTFFGRDAPLAMPVAGDGPRRGPMRPKADSRYLSAEASAKLVKLEGELEALRKASPPEPDMACGVADGASVEQKVFIRGSVTSPGEDAPKQFLQIIAGENQTPVAKGSGRLELAEWLIQPNHPLTSRVMANRIWQYHFADGLVRSSNNWGRLGETPSHPELLDWLAKRFVEGGWSVKKMHRMIMLSNAYQMSSEITPQQNKLDLDNRLISRMSRRRLDVEELRDGMLEIAGALDLTMGGTLQSGFGTDGENAAGRLSIDPATSTRRTVYLPIRRSNLPTMFNLFDFGDATTPGEGRDRTNVAPQALFMMNSAFVKDRAEGLAKLVNKDRAVRIEQAYLRVLNRRPSAEEIATAEQYIAAFHRKAEDSRVPVTEDRALQSFCHILLGSNEFIYVD